jgi:Tol biopolymer transport system component
MRMPASGQGRATLLLKVGRYIPQSSAFVAVASSWSPDGSQIAFSTGAYGLRSALYTVNADGSGVTKVPNVRRAFDPAWRPQ